MKNRAIELIVLSPLILLFCGSTCMAKPDVSERVSKPSGSTNTKQTKNLKSTQTQTTEKEENKSTSKRALFDDEAANTSVSEFAKEYAALMKKATTAIHLKWPLKMKEEQKLWADYKSGKYAKNKDFMRNMKLAEPYHNRLRSILHVFESQRFKHLDFSHPPAGQPNQPEKK